MAKHHYYAVQRGFVPGVYPSWREAERQIKGYRYAKHKGFDDLAEAEVFAGAPLVVDRYATPFVVVHDGEHVQRYALTDEVRAALNEAGLDLGAR